MVQYVKDGTKQLGRTIMSNHSKGVRKGFLQNHEKKQAAMNDIYNRSIKDINNAVSKQKIFNKLVEQGRIKGRTITGKYEILDKDKKNVIKKISSCSS